MPFRLLKGVQPQLIKPSSTSRSARSLQDLISVVLQRYICSSMDSGAPARQPSDDLDGDSKRAVDPDIDALTNAQKQY